MHKLFPASLALALAAPLGAMGRHAVRHRGASTRDRSDAGGLRSPVAGARTARQDGRSGGRNAGAAAAPPVAAAPAAPPGPVAAPPAVAASGGGLNSFNPALALILSGLYTRTSQDPSKYAITGFQLPSNVGVGPGTRGFSLAESELDLSASIDPWLRGAANISLQPDNTVSVEEAYVQTTTLGDGFSLKAGRFFSGIGYLNPQHAHTWDFVDNPLVYQALLGTQYGDDGLQLNWLAPTDQYIELGAELGRGRSYPGSDTSRNGAGMFALIAHTGGDIGDSSSWRAGVSMLNAKANDLSSPATDAGGRTATSVFSGTRASGSPTRSGNGRRTATRRGRISRSRGSICAARAAATFVPDLANADRLGRVPRASSPAGTCRASTSSCRAGASACAPSA